MYVEGLSGVLGGAHPASCRSFVIVINVHGFQVLGFKHLVAIDAADIVHPIAAR